MSVAFKSSFSVSGAPAWGVDQKPTYEGGGNVVYISGQDRDTEAGLPRTTEDNFQRITE